MDVSCSDGYVKEKETSVLFKLLVIWVSVIAAIFLFKITQEVSWD